jgi:L-iditol 2-dehydrogenase
VQLAKRKGAQVIAIGRSHEKLEQAKSFGADHVFSVLDRGDVLQQALSATPQGRGFDAVVEAIGQPQTWKQAVQLARKGGVVCLYGGCAKGSHFELDTHRVHYQELKIFGVFHHTPRHFKQALEFLSKGELDAERFISGEISLEDIPQHFRSHTDKPFAKVAVIP